MDRRVVRFLVALGIACAGAPVLAAPIAPPIATGLEDLEGRPAVLDSTAKRVLVSFWATWCTSCRVELKRDLPALDKIPDLEIVTINTDADRERAQALIQRERVTLRTLRDPTSEYRRKLGVQAVPHWALYERVGAEWRVLASREAFDGDAIRALLAKAPGTAASK